MTPAEEAFGLAREAVTAKVSRGWQILVCGAVHPADPKTPGTPAGVAMRTLGYRDVLVTGDGEIRQLPKGWRDAQPESAQSPEEMGELSVYDGVGNPFPEGWQERQDWERGAEGEAEILRYSEQDEGDLEDDADREMGFDQILFGDGIGAK